MFIYLLGNWVLPTPVSQVGCGKRESKAKEKEEKGMEEEQCIYSEMGIKPTKEELPSPPQLGDPWAGLTLPSCAGG